MPERENKNRDKASDAVESLKKDEKHPNQDETLEEALEDTFPASDPVSATRTTTVGNPSKDRKSDDD